jgi:hypothetical protein
MSMMPLGWFQRIDHGLIHQTGWKVHPRKILIAILHKPRPMGTWGVSPRAISRIAVVVVGREKWMPILLPAHPLEKLATDFWTQAYVAYLLCR